MVLLNNVKIFVGPLRWCKNNSYTMSGIYHMNGVPTAYSTIAEEVQKGRDAKISHLLAQVTKNYCNNYYKYVKT